MWHYWETIGINRCDQWTRRLNYFGNVEKKRGGNSATNKYCCSLEDVSHSPNVFKFQLGSITPYLILSYRTNKIHYLPLWSSQFWPSVEQNFNYSSVCMNGRHAVGQTPTRSNARWCISSLHNFTICVSAHDNNYNKWISFVQLLNRGRPGIWSNGKIIP